MRKALSATAAAAALLVPLQAGAQEWSYQTHAGEGTPWQQTITFRLVESSPGQHRARFMMGGTMDECIRRELRATVELQADEQFVVLHPAMAGCPERRMVLKTDGSGGRMEVKQSDGSWKWDGHERVIKRK
jgi:hypothetical protein